MQAARFSEACVKLAESQRLEAAAGTLLNLALCHEKEGKTATAWLEYNDALALAAHEGDAERKEIARQRIEALEESLSRLVMLLPTDPPHDLWIELDGVRLSTVVSGGAGVPVDPGAHVIRLGAPGKQTATLDAQVDAMTTRVAVQLPQLTNLPPPPTPPSAREPPPSLSPLRDQPPPDTRLRWAANGALLGVGVAGVALASYFGLRAKSDWDTRNQHCRSGCDSEAVVAGANAKRASVLATVSGVTGVLALGLGVYLVLTTPRGGNGPHARISASATERGASIALEGQF